MSILRFSCLPLLVLLFNCGPVQAQKTEAIFVRKIDWVGKGVWLQADTHIHTGFSDGGFLLGRVVDEAVKNGCHVIGITDHADRNLSAATPQYRAAIEAARVKLEWNVPPWGGDEHATVLVPPGRLEWQTLAAFKARFDDLKRVPHVAALADEGLRWLAKQKNASGVAPLVLFNHPNRKRDDVLSLVKQMKWWRTISSQTIVGFSGAPGHQLSQTLGNYTKKIKLIDRWDPIAATIGGGWDKLLQQNVDVWAARAPSDFHNFKWDYWPGQFSQTWIYARSKSADAVFEALRAGSVFGVHGRIVDRAELSVMARGLPRPAINGESIRVPADSTIKVQIAFRIPKLDWEGKKNQLNEIELIGITRDGASSLIRKPVRGGETAVVVKLSVPAGGIVIRARGRRVENGPDLLFYTNPVRIQTAK
jgi:hypothetical protein